MSTLGDELLSKQPQALVTSRLDGHPEGHLMSLQMCPLQIITCICRVCIWAACNAAATAAPTAAAPLGVVCAVPRHVFASGTQLA